MQFMGYEWDRPTPNDWAIFAWAAVFGLLIPAGIWLSWVRTHKPTRLTKVLASIWFAVGLPTEIVALYRPSFHLIAVAVGTLAVGACAWYAAWGSEHDGEGEGWK